MCRKGRKVCEHQNFSNSVGKETDTTQASLKRYALPSLLKVVLLMYLPATNYLCFLGGLLLPWGPQQGQRCCMGRGQGHSINLLLKESCEWTLEKDSSTSSCHPLCSHCMFYINEEAKKPHECLNIQIKITCKRFIIMLTFFPFSQVFFLFRFTGEEYLNTQGIQVMPMGYGRMMWLLFQTCI